MDLLRGHGKFLFLFATFSPSGMHPFQIVFHVKMLFIISLLDIDKIQHN